MTTRNGPALSSRLIGLLFCSVALGMGIGKVHARSLAEIEKSKELRVCISPLNPSIASATPSGCREKCTYSGPTYEEVLAFVAALGTDIKASFLSVAWDEQFHNSRGETDRDASYTPELLASGVCDIYPSKVTKNAWRVKKLRFATQFLSRMMVIVNKSDKREFKTIANLAGKVAAVEKDTSFHTWLQEQNESEFAANPIQIKLMQMNASTESVDAGEVDFTLMDSDTAIWFTRHHFNNTVVAFPVGPTDEIGWAFRKQDTELQAAVRKFFDDQKASATSTLNQIWERHFGVTLGKFESLIRATQ